MIERIQVLLGPACPHGPGALERVREVVARLAPQTPIRVLEVETLEDARRLGMPGSPTVTVDGVDLEGGQSGAASLSCRLYGRSGVPPVWLVEAAILRALRPTHLLFLCVANSARSQMAEGLARQLAPADVNISSAGSEPSRIRPEAVAVLAELGIDASRHRSKGIDEVEGTVDAVITLCAEEVCPVWLGAGHRVHWGLPDPAAVTGGGEERLQAFRTVRDELRTRLEICFEREPTGPIAPA